MLPSRPEAFLVSIQYTGDFFDFSSGDGYLCATGHSDHPVFVDSLRYTIGVDKIGLMNPEKMVIEVFVQTFHRFGDQVPFSVSGMNVGVVAIPLQAGDFMG